jgi:glycosyltransferase involved in cell wall biosynthesis
VNGGTTVLHLLPHLGVGGPAKQVLLTAPLLPRDRFTVRVAGLGGADHLTAEFQRAGLDPTALGRPGDPALVIARRFLRLLRELEPGVIHTWGPAAWRTAALLARWPWLRGPAGRPRLVASAVLRGRRRPVRLRLWERPLLRRTDRIVVADEGERHNWKRLGLAEERVVLVPPAVAVPEATPDAAAFRRSLGLPDGCRLVMTAGRLVARAGWRDALWAFDILRYIHPDLHLVVFGDGPDRHLLEGFVRNVGLTDVRTHFAGVRPDAAALFPLAEVVWVPNNAEGGGGVAREALAAGVPVVAVRQPDAAAVVADGETGFLAAPHDRAELAARTQRLLTDPGLRRRLGAAGRRAADQFAPGPAAAALADLYQHVVR